jgi:hypothetical protein
MNYYGFTLQSNISEDMYDAILRPALMAGSGDALPVRGPKEFTRGERRYTFSTTGIWRILRVLRRLQKVGWLCVACTAMAGLSIRF